MKILITTVCILLIGLSLHAQSEDYKMVGGIHAGWSLTGSIVKNIADTEQNGGDVNASAIPAMQLSFDYGLSKVVSLGLAFSHQRVSKCYRLYLHR